MKKVKSVFVHKNFYRNGQEVAVYLALVAIPCEHCSSGIEANEMFSRSANKAGTVPGIRYSFCKRCMPFEESPIDVEERKARINKSEEF